MPSSSTVPARRLWIGGAVVFALIGISVGWAVYRWWNHKPDERSAFRANNEGIACIERFNYPGAVDAFEETLKKAPDWPVAKINLGIALMNLARGQKNAAREDSTNRAISLFHEVLEDNPDNPYARFCLGRIHYELLENWKEARSHFEAVTLKDPADAYAWYWLGTSQMIDNDDEAALKSFRQAYSLNPYLNAALHSLHLLLRKKGKEAEANAIMNENEALRAAEVLDIVDPQYYTDVGPYAQVIGRFPQDKTQIQIGPLPPFIPSQNFKVHLAPGATWANREDLKRSPQGELISAVRDRFGATMVELDYNRDGKPDLFLLSAVIENGQVRDLLLRNDGDGAFTDVTAEAGLAGPRASIGCTVGDFDNNEFPDLFITGAGRQWLFRNDGKGRFEDVTSEAGLDKLTSVCLGSAFVDLDQDSDLDLLVAQYAATQEEALSLLQGKGNGKLSGGLAVFLNDGKVPAVLATDDPPPCKPKFRRLFKPADLIGSSAPVVSLASSDLDDDHDLDFLVLADGRPIAAVLNDRLLRFHRTTLPEKLIPHGRWNGALVFDAHHNGRSDLFVVGPGQTPVFLVSKSLHEDKDVVKRFEQGITNSPPLLQAQAIDLDYDGWTDILGLSEQRIPVLLQNDGTKLVHRLEALGPDGSWPKDLVALRAGRFSVGKYQDLILWSEANGLQLHLNQGNGNNSVTAEITGHRKKHNEYREGVCSAQAKDKSRCNSDAFGATIAIHSENLWSGLEYTTLSASLGQSHQPVILGLGRHHQPDVVRLRWPDNVIQAELNIPAGELTRIDEVNFKDISCPILFTWNGERFVFITDFLGAGSMGELEPDGNTRPPRPEESVKIEAEQLVPKGGKYILKIAEPMNEATYLDRLQLLVLDHPGDVRVYPDERFTSGPPASQDLLAFREEIFPVIARDHRGKDVTQTLAKWDRHTVDDFAQRSWLGYAEEHWVELDFGNRLAKFNREDRLILCLAGWTEYPYPESIWAATQAGIPMVPPTLERLDDKGQWQTLVADAGFPAGLPRMMTLDVTGKLTGPRCVVRLRTNMEVYWDQIFVAPVLKADTFKVSTHEVARAMLTPCGLMQEFSPDGRLPTIYDYDRQQTVAVSRLAGKMTRYGEVTELLRDRDDRFVIFGPGDELTVEFDAKNLPPLPPGWKRSFVLKTWGYCKDCSLWTATGDTIEPLPFQKMSKYPYGPLTPPPLPPGGEGGVRGSVPEEHYPDDPLHQDYLRRYQTRQVGLKVSTSR
jgi:tetratricopeptide (TPR) repeat protein